MWLEIDFLKYFLSDGENGLLLCSCATSGAESVQSCSPVPGQTSGCIQGENSKRKRKKKNQLLSWTQSERFQSKERKPSIRTGLCLRMRMQEALTRVHLANTANRSLSEYETRKLEQSKLPRSTLKFPNGTEKGLESVKMLSARVVLYPQQEIDSCVFPANQKQMVD